MQLYSANCRVVPNMERGSRCTQRTPSKIGAPGAPVRHIQCMTMDGPWHAAVGRRTYHGPHPLYPPLHTWIFREA